MPDRPPMNFEEVARDAAWVDELVVEAMAPASPPLASNCSPAVLTAKKMVAKLDAQLNYGSSQSDRVYGEALMNVASSYMHDIRAATIAEPNSAVVREAVGQRRPLTPNTCNFVRTMACGLAVECSHSLSWVSTYVPDLELTPEELTVLRSVQAKISKMFTPAKKKTSLTQQLHAHLLTRSW